MIWVPSFGPCPRRYLWKTKRVWDEPSAGIVLKIFHLMVHGFVQRVFLIGNHRPLFFCHQLYIWSCLPPARSPPPNGMDLQVAPPFPSICKLLAAFLKSSFVFARSLQHFWLLGTCYLLGDLRSTHTPSKYLRATYSHIYIHVLCIYCIYFLFTTCVLWQHYLCLTYIVPTIHVNDAMHTIPIISIIHNTYHTYHTYEM